MHLSIRPRFCATRYARTRAYGNHFRVLEDNHANTMATYDFGVALVFQQEQVSKEGTTLGPIHYVGILKNIIVLDYGLVSQPIVLFKFVNGLKVGLTYGETPFTSTTNMVFCWLIFIT